MFDLIGSNGMSQFFMDFVEKQNDIKNPLVTDITEKDGEYTLSANLAGFDKKDINVDFSKGYLTISAEKSEKEEDEDNYHLKESYSSYKRSFYLGNNFSEDDIKAKFKDGLLIVTFKKLEEKNSSIEIK